MGKRETAKNIARKLGPREGKKNNLGWYIGALYIPVAILYALIATRSISNTVEVYFFLIMMGVVSVGLLLLKSDDTFYKVLNLKNFVYAVLCGLAMTALSWGLSNQVLHNPNILLSVNGFNYLSADSAGLSASNSFGFIPTTSSVLTTFIWMALGGLIMAATVEELFKLVFIAEGQKRWANGLTLSKGAIFGVGTALALFLTWFILNALGRFELYTFGIISGTALIVFGLIVFKGLKNGFKIPGAVGFIGFPVAFWACLHSLSAYNDPVMIIPAAINGVILAIYLLKTHCILGAIGAHWFYNCFILFITFITGTAGIPAGTPLFPPIFSAAYYSNSTFILEEFLLFPLIIWAIGFWLLPSLKGKNQ